MDKIFNLFRSPEKRYQIEKEKRGKIEIELNNPEIQDLIHKLNELGTKMHIIVMGSGIYGNGQNSPEYKKLSEELEAIVSEHGKEIAQYSKEKAEKLLAENVRLDHEEERMLKFFQEKGYYEEEKQKEGLE